MKPPSKTQIFMLASIILAAIVKIVLLLTKVVPFNSDEAIVTLMARTILQGERPVFFYGQAYMGSLDAWLTAGVMWVVKDPVLSIRFVQMILYTGFLLSLGWLAGKWLEFREYRWIPMVLAAIPPVAVTTYTSASLGGYGEVLFLGNLILGLGYDVIFGGKEQSLWRWAALGFMGGVAFWTLGMAGVYLLTLFVWIVLRCRWKNLPFYCLSFGMFLVGSLPWLAAVINLHGAPILTLLHDNVNSTPIANRLLTIILYSFPSILGFRFPWSSLWLPAYIVFWGIMINMATLLAFIRKDRFGIKQLRAGSFAVLMTFTTTLFFVLIFSQYSRDPTGRYCLPLLLPLIFAWSSLVIGLWQIKKNWGIAVLVLILAFNGIATIQAAESPDRITTQFDPISRFDNAGDKELMTFLQKHNAVMGYSNYWVSYRLAALSQEKIIFSPRLPYKEDMSYTADDNRYPLYDEWVDNANNAAYITTLHPALDSILQENFNRLGVVWKEARIGAYHIFYDFYKKIDPREIIYPDRKP